MTSATVQLQQEITAQERAIRQLIGEQKALNSKTARADATLKLEEAKLKKAQVVKPSADPYVTIPSGSRFPDVSSYQPHVDLATIRNEDLNIAGNSGTTQLVVFKATEGTSYVDGFIETRWAQAKALKFPHRGAYHFLHPSESGTAQAQHFLSKLPDITDQDILICDAEVSDGMNAVQIGACLLDFGNEVMKQVPAKRWLYAPGPFAVEFGLDLAPFQAHWLPAYVGKPQPYFVPKFGVPIAWQFTDGVHGPQPHDVVGIGSCDVSIIL